MSGYADRVALGYLPLRHHGDDYTLDFRTVVYGARISKQEAGAGASGFDKYGRLVGETKAGHGENSHGDLNCATFWPAEDTRPISGWAFAWPAVLTKAVEDGPTAGTGTISTASLANPSTQAAKQTTARPVRKKDWNADERFKEKPVALPKTIKALPKNYPGLVIAGTEEFDQEDLFLPCGGGGLVAPHHAGKGKLGSLVFDTTDKDELDELRKGYLQTLTRVHRLPAVGIYGPVDEKALALQIGKARWPDDGPDKVYGAIFAERIGGGAGGGVSTNTNAGFETRQHMGSISHHLDGPIKINPCQKHFHGKSQDDDRYGAVHIHSNAFYNAGGETCGPLEFGGAYPKCKPPPGDCVEVYLSYDDKPNHNTVLGTRKGLWRWWTRVPIYNVPPPVTYPEFIYPQTVFPEFFPESFPQPYEQYPEFFPQPYESYPQYFPQTFEQTPQPVPTDGPTTTTGGGSGVNETGDTGAEDGGAASLINTLTHGFNQGGDLPISEPTVAEQILEEINEYLEGLLTESQNPPPAEPKVHAPYLGTTQELGVPALLGRATNFHPGGLDLRNAPFVSKVAEQFFKGKYGGDKQEAGSAPNFAEAARKFYDSDRPTANSAPNFAETARKFYEAEKNSGRTAGSASANFSDLARRFYDATAPIVSRRESIAKQQGMDYVYTHSPCGGQSRNGSGSATGAEVFGPPEVGMEQIVAGTIPNIRSVTNFIMHLAGLQFGEPTLTTGGAKSGFQISLSSDTNTLTINELDSDGTVGTAAMTINRSTNTVQVYGTTIGAGGNCPCTPGLFGDASETHTA